MMAEETIDTQQQHNRAILKSTALLGGSSFVTMLIGMVKSKIVAILLGPSGIGYISVLTNLQQMIVTVAGLGLSSSGVRELSHAISGHNDKYTLVTTKSIRMIVWSTGILGLVLMIVGSKGLSQLSFNSPQYSTAIAFLGFSVLFSIVSSGQSSVIQGFRRIDYVAKINVIGSVIGAITSIACYYFWRTNGVVPSLIVTAAATLATAWFYSHKIEIPVSTFNKSDIANESKRLIALGTPIMLSGVLTTGVSYLIRIFLTRRAGLDGVGQYQAAFSFASVLVNFVLSAMGTDYLPRLTAVSEDNAKVNKEVNAQTQIALLLAVPLLAATMIFMPFLIRLFYSSKFDQAVPILRWAILGILGRIISWPMGFIMIAKSKSKIYFITELSANIINLGSTILFYDLFGLEGGGIAFAALYLVYSILMVFTSRHICSFSWDRTNIKLIAASILIVLCLFIINILNMSLIIKYSVGIVIFVATSIIYIRKLSSISGLKLGRYFGRR